MNAQRAGEEPAVERLCRQIGRLTAELSGPLRRIRVCSGDATVEIEWQTSAATAPRAPGTSGPVASTGPRGTGIAGAHSSAGPVAGDAVAARTVVSPIVGTFYRAPEPGAAPYVEVGDVIEAGQVIGIVEAMKLMNQITAEQTGRVVEVLVGDGAPVEFEQPLVALVDA